jgi:uncharacterized membrane protein YkvA (DUF1232 family)
MYGRHVNEKKQYRALLAGGKKTLVAAIDQIWTLKCVLRHPRVPWRARMVAAVSVMYLVSPIQIIPTFIPVIGQLDDLLVLFVGMKLVRKLTPKEIVEECERPHDRPVLLQRLRREPQDALLLEGSAPIELR